MTHPPPRPTLFPYTTLFRSSLVPSVCRLGGVDPNANSGCCCCTFERPSFCSEHVGDIIQDLGLAVLKLDLAHCLHALALGCEHGDGRARYCDDGEFIHRTNEGGNAQCFWARRTLD